MASENVQTFTDGNFDQTVLKAARPCSWTSGRSGADRAACSGRPSISAGDGLAGKAAIGKLNVDENPAVPAAYSIRGIPTLLLFKGGQIVDRSSAWRQGHSKQLIESTLDEASSDERGRDMARTLATSSSSARARPG